MKNVVTNLYPEYLRYIDSFRAIPWKIDALKPVERRLLLTVHEVARTKLQKSAKVVGFCLGKWHPHGDIACYEALAGLVNRGLVTGQGNWGSMGLEDMSCAAQRYCLIGQTPISTNFGSIEIEKLKLAKELNLKLNCLSYNQTVNSVSEFFDSGVHPTIKIETEYDLTLQGSYNHPIIILNRNLEFEWKTLENINEGDFAVILTNNNICENSFLTEDEALILGCLLSEGWFGQEKIGFSNVCDIFFQDYKSTIEKYLQISNCHIQIQILPSGKKLNRIEVCGKEKTSKLFNIGYNGYKSKHIIIPDSIYKSSKKVQSVFLRYLFQGDGSIHMSKRNMVISYSSISEKLILQLRELLINSFGIFTNIHYFQYTDEIRLICHDRKSIFKFISEIGFVPDTDKYKISQKIINTQYIKTSRPKYDYIPYLKEFVLQNKIIKSSKKNKVTEKLKRSLSYNFKDTLNLNYEFISSLLEKKDISKINNLLIEDYKFLKIIKKEKCEPENVFCIRIDSNCHSFVSNGFISHNTEIKANKFLDDTFSEFLEFAPHQELELDSEPLYLPSPIPIGLVGEGMILGIGNNITRTPRYLFSDLIKRSSELITNSLTKTTIVPQISNCDVYEDSPGEFERILSTGEGIIQCVPRHKTNGNKILIYGRNPLYGYSKLKSYNVEYESKNGSPAYNLVDLSKERLCIQVSPYRGPISSDFELLIAKLISTRIKVICNFVDNDLAVRKFSIDDILLASYDSWKSCYLSSLNNDLSKLQKKSHEYTVLQIARDIYLNNPNVKTVSDICNLYVLNKVPGIESQDIENACSKYSLKKAIESDLDIPAIQAEISLKQTDISNIDTLAFNKLNTLA